jgi:hypothetical protein
MTTRSSHPKGRNHRVDFDDRPRERTVSVQVVC